MKNLENLMKVLEEITERLLSGEYENAEDEIKRYKELKRQLEAEGVQTLDGLNFETLIF